MMNSTFDLLYDYNNIRSQNTIHKNSIRQADVSISEELAGFQKLRISALTKAAEISPLIKKATIGPNSISKKGTRVIKDKTVTKDKNKVEQNLIIDKLSDDLRYRLIMKEHEAQLHQTSEVLYRKLIENVLNKRAEAMNEFLRKQSEHNERKAMEVRLKNQHLLRELQENDNLCLLEEAKLDEKKSCEMVNRETIDNINRILEEENRATKRFASLTESHTKIYICYNEITKIFNTEQHAKEVCDKYISCINTVMGNISVIMDLCKNAFVTDKEVRQAEILSLNMDNIMKKIIDDLNYIKQKELLIKQEEEEAMRIKILEEQKYAAESKAETENVLDIVPVMPTATKPMFYSTKNYDYFKELCSFLKHYEAQYKDLLDDVRFKKFRFDCQKAVNTPINALSSVSGHHIRDKYEKLYKLLNGERVQVLDIHVIATQYPQGLPYCTALLAKKIVRQGELLVSSNTEAAFPLAAVSVALYSKFPDFGKLLEAYLQKQCPYLVPMFLPQKEGQTDKDFYISRGYTYNENGVVEKQDKFLNRMSGIFRLSCAIWIAKTPKDMNAPNPLGLKYGWRWLASFVNLKPEPDISATLLLEFLTVCGSDCMKLYNTQFKKAIDLISKQYMSILQNIDEGGPKTRLDVFIQNVSKTGHIVMPSGIIDNNW